MSHTAGLHVDTATEAVAALPPVQTSDLNAIGDAIAVLAARLHAATYELLVLLREFDAAAGWNNGFLSRALVELAHGHRSRLRSAGITITPYTATPQWYGERFDVGWAIDALRGQPATTRD